MKNDYLKYLISLLLFGSNGVVASFIELSSYEIVLLRSVIGSVFLIALFLISKNKYTFMNNKKDAVYISLSGVAMAADWLLLFEAYKRIGVSLGMLINYCGPIIVVFISAVIFREHISSRKMTALICTFVGAVLISGNALAGDTSFVGVVCAIISAFSYAGMILFNKRAKHIKGMENSVLQLLFACLTVIFFVGIKQGIYVPVSKADIIPVLWLGAINTGLSCFLYFSSVSKLPVQTVAVCGYLEPVSAVIMSFLILHERMSILQIVGAILIIAGAIYGECRCTKKQMSNKKARGVHF